MVVLADLGGEVWEAYVGLEAIAVEELVARRAAEVPARGAGWCKCIAFLRQDCSNK